MSLPVAPSLEWLYALLGAIFHKKKNSAEYIAKQIIILSTLGVGDYVNYWMVTSVSY